VHSFIELSLGRVYSKALKESFQDQLNNCLKAYSETECKAKISKSLQEINLHNEKASEEIINHLVLLVLCGIIYFALYLWISKVKKIYSFKMSNS